MLGLLGGKTPSSAHARYKAYVSKGLREDRDSLARLEGRPIVGGEDFEKFFQPCLHDLARLRRVAMKKRRQSPPALSELLDEASPRDCGR